MRRFIPEAYNTYLQGRSDSLFGQDDLCLRPRAFIVGAFLSFFLAVGAPYANMIIRGTYMARDFSTPGAIALFLLLVGPINAVLKWAGRSLSRSLAISGCIGAAFFYSYSGLSTWDIYSPGSHFFLILLLLSLGSVWASAQGRGGFALNRAELIVVYAMLLIVSALCTMGLSEQILPMITAIFYFATPENKWQEKLFPIMGDQPTLVHDGAENTTFYEGLERGETIPWENWIEPLCWWGVFLLALYITMVSIAVILRRQWMERERLSYPMTQVALSIVQDEDGTQSWNRFFRRRSMWLGALFPLLVGSLKALHRYDPAFPTVGLLWFLPFVGKQSLRLDISFSMVGFSYFINTQIAAGLWFFHLLSKVQKELLSIAGFKSDQKVVYGVADFPFMAYQGVGALLAMVLVGLWIGREHLKNVFFKAIGRAPEVEDGDEIISYRSALIGAVGGMATMAVWMWIMGTEGWVAAAFVVVAMLIFIGVARIVAEAGLAVVRAPMTAPDLITLGLGSQLIGPSSVWNLSMAYIWASDIRVFVMGTCANALKLIEEMPPVLRRMVFGAIVLALFIGALGSIWMVFHMAYYHGGINLNAWFFKNAPQIVYQNALRNLDPTGVYWQGMSFFAGGGVVMTVMMWARQRFPWWPFHPIGFPIGANGLMDKIWFSIFIAWVLKWMLMRYGGAHMFSRSRYFFLGLICGQFLCSGFWLFVDYFTGKIGNGIFDL